MFERGHIGRLRSAPEGDHDQGHYMKCPGCGRWFDMRDLGASLEHYGDLPHGPSLSKWRQVTRAIKDAVRRARG